MTEEEKTEIVGKWLHKQEIVHSQASKLMCEKKYEEARILVEAFENEMWAAIRSL